MRRVESRPVGGAGLQPVLDLLTAPLAAAAGAEVVPLVDGTVRSGRPLRAPAILIRLKAHQARTAVVVRWATTGVDNPRPAVFTAWSAAGSLLPLYVPTLAPGTEGTGPVELTLSVWTVAGSAAHLPATALAAATGPGLAPAAAADLVEAVLLEGHLARLLHLQMEEKQRITATAREIAASRHAGLARGWALDAIGADHRVPRLDGEDDDAYRGRLQIYTSWRLATPAGFERALNGVPDGTPDGGPNTGLPATAGVQPRFRIVERNDELAVWARLVEVGPGPDPSDWRKRFLSLAAAGLLFDLETLPDARLPAGTRDRLSEVRKLLRDRLIRGRPVTERRYMTVLVATCLARAVQVLKLLADPGKLTLLSALTRGTDPRLDLGLGVTVRPLEDGRVDRAVTQARAVQAAGGVVGPAVPPDVLAAALRAEVRDRTDDPEAAWLFEAAGLQATRLDEDTLFLTPLPAHGLVIEGPGRLAPGQSGRYLARLRGSGGSGRHVLVDEAWRRAAPALAHGGNLAPMPLDPPGLDQALRAVAEANPPAKPPPALVPLVAEGLMPASAADFAARVRDSYDLDLVLGYVLDPGVGGLGPDDPPAVAARQALVAALSTLTAAGFHTVRVLPRPDGLTLLVLAAVSVLPGGSSRPGEPVPAMYRWYVAPFPPPLAGSQGRQLGREADAADEEDWSYARGGRRIARPKRWPPAPLAVRRGVGGQVDLVAVRPGVALVVCVAYVRRGLADPYEVRLELPQGEVLDLGQYGYVMNLLEHLCPLGIEINTFELRRNHVSPDGGPPQFLSGQVSRSYTRYRRRRPLGAPRYGPPDPD